MKPAQNRKKHEAYTEFKKNIKQSAERAKSFKTRILKGKLSKSDISSLQELTNSYKYSNPKSAKRKPEIHTPYTRSYHRKSIEINDQTNVASFNNRCNTEYSPPSVSVNSKNIFLTCPNSLGNGKNSCPPLDYDNRSTPLLNINNLQKLKIIDSTKTDRSDFSRSSRSFDKTFLTTRSTIKQNNDLIKVQNMTTPKKINMKISIPKPDYLNYSEYLKNSDRKKEILIKHKTSRSEVPNTKSSDGKIFSEFSLSLPRLNNNSPFKRKYYMNPQLNSKNSFENEHKSSAKSYTKIEHLSAFSPSEKEKTNVFPLLSSRTNVSSLGSIDEIEEMSKNKNFLEPELSLSEPVISLPSLRLKMSYHQFQLNEQPIFKSFMETHHKHFFLDKLKFGIAELEMKRQSKTTGNNIKANKKINLANFEKIRGQRRVGLVDDTNVKWVQSISSVINLNKIVKTVGNSSKNNASKSVKLKNAYIDYEERRNKLDNDLLCKLNDYKQSYLDHIEIKSRNLDNFLETEKNCTINKLLKKNRRDQENYSLKRVTKDFDWYKELIDEICTINYGINEGVMQLFDKIKFLLERAVKLNINNMIKILNDIDASLFKNEGFLYILLKIGQHNNITKFNYLRYFEERRMFDIVKILANKHI